MPRCEICGKAENVTFCKLCQKSLCPACKSDLVLRLKAAVRNLVQKVKGVSK